MDRNTWRKPGNLVPVPVARQTKIYAGHIVCLNAYGFAVINDIQSSYRVIGVADEMVDNASGEDGDKVVMVRRMEAFLFANSTVMPIRPEQVGMVCHLEDSVTVSQTTVDFPPVGRVLEITPDGVWVYVDFNESEGQ